jgi:hypothetical protein
MDNDFNKLREKIKTRQIEANRKGDRKTVIKLFGQRHISAVQNLAGEELENELIDISSKIREWVVKLNSTKRAVEDFGFAPIQVSQNVNIVNDLGSYLLLFSKNPYIDPLKLKDIDTTDTKQIMKELRKKNGYLISSDDGDIEAFESYIYALLYADVTRNIDNTVRSLALTQLDIQRGDAQITRGQKPSFEYNQENIISELADLRESMSYTPEEIKDAQDTARTVILNKIDMDITEITGQFVDGLSDNNRVATGIFEKFEADQKASFGMLKKAGTSRLLTFALYGIVFTMSLAVMKPLINDLSYSSVTSMKHVEVPQESSMFYSTPPIYEDRETTEDVETALYKLFYLTRVVWWAFIPLSQLLDGLFVGFSERTNDYKNLLNSVGAFFGMMFVALALGHMSGVFEYQIPQASGGYDNWYPDFIINVSSVVITFLNLILGLCLQVCAGLAEGVDWLQTTDRASNLLSVSSGIKLITSVVDEYKLFDEYKTKRKFAFDKLKEDTGPLAFNISSFNTFKTNLGGGEGGLTKKVAEDLQTFDKLLVKVNNTELTMSRRNEDNIRMASLAQGERGLAIQERIASMTETKSTIQAVDTEFFMEIQSLTQRYEDLTGKSLTKYDENKIKEVNEDLQEVIKLSTPAMFSW